MSLHCRLCCARRCRPLPCAGLYLHDRSAAGGLRGRDDRHPASEGLGRERARHQNRVARLKSMLDANGLPQLRNGLHIVPVPGDAKICKAVSDYLLNDFGIYIQPINYPTVQRGTERLRITPSPLHTDEHIDKLVVALSDGWRKFNLWS